MESLLEPRLLHSLAWPPVLRQPEYEHHLPFVVSHLGQFRVHATFHLIGPQQSPRERLVSFSGFALPLGLVDLVAFQLFAVPDVDLGIHGAQSQTRFDRGLVVCFLSLLEVSDPKTSREQRRTRG